MRIIETFKLPADIKNICEANIKIAKQVLKEEKVINKFHLYQPSFKQEIAIKSITFWERVYRECE